MPKVTAYHRPETFEEALELLSTPGRVPLAGGTVVNTPGGAPVEAVDLQSLGLDGITAGAGITIRMGATTSLYDIIDSEIVPPIVREVARWEAPSTLRAQATIGGTVAARDPESLLVAALLVHEAVVETRSADGRSETPLGEYLAAGRAGALITAVIVDVGGDVQLSVTGRTPADVPIVAAIARRHAGTTTLALTGVAATPILVDPQAPTAALSTATDFRGSAGYRLHLAAVHAGRAVARLG